MQHNAVLLVGLLSRASVAFRRRFANENGAMEVIINMLQCPDNSTLANVLWALRSLASEGILGEASTRRATVSHLRPLFSNQDPRVAGQSKALAETLKRPRPLNTKPREDEEAAAALGSILHTPPPSLSVALEQRSPASRKRKATSEPAGEEPEARSTSRRLSERVAPSRRDVFAEEEEVEEVEEVTPVDAPVSAESAALSFLIQAADG
jgi:hypothetical protein